MKKHLMRRIPAALLGLVTAVSMMPPGVVYAADSNRTVVAEANATNGDVTVTADNVTPTVRYNGDAIGVLASAQDGKTATATVRDINVNIASADFQFGVRAYSGDDWDTYTAGTVVVNCGNVTCAEQGISASAEYDGSSTTIHASGDVQATLCGVDAGTSAASEAKVIVDGNVTVTVGANGERTGVSVNASRGGNSSVEVDGNVTTVDGAGVQFRGRYDGNDVLVTGTVSGSKGILTDIAYYDTPGTNKLTVWKVTATTGSADDLFVKRVAFRDYQVDDITAANTNYIVRHTADLAPLAANGSALATSHGYSVAKEGEVIRITATGGKTVVKAYNAGTEITTKDAAGFWCLTVPRGGGISLTADISDAPAPDPDPDPNPDPDPDPAPDPDPDPNPNPDPDPTPDPDPAPEPEGVSGFVTRLYYVFLDRTPEQDEVEGWTTQIVNGTISAGQAAAGFIFSPEFINRNMCNAHFLDYLYLGLFNRAADDAGKDGWTFYLDEGWSREMVVQGFLMSPEFFNLCEAYAVNPGTGLANVPALGTIQTDHCTIAGCPNDAPVKIMVVSLYDTVFGRVPSQDEVDFWVNHMAAHTPGVTARVMVNTFLNGAEYSNLNRNNAEYVTDLYHAIFNREPDAGGFNGWLNDLDTGIKTREEVLNGFTGSPEFIDQCHHAGIEIGGEIEIQ